MRSLGSSTIMLLQQGVFGLAQLLRVQLPSGDLALNTSNMDLVHAGVTYRGAAGLGTVSAIKDASGEAQGLQLEMSGGDAAMLAVALDGGDEFQGALVTVRTALIDAATGQVVDAPIEWTGIGDTFGVNEDGAQAGLAATAESDQVDLLRGRPLTCSDGDHQSVFPGDRAFEYLQSQVGQPVVWPSKEFYYK